MYPFAVFVAIIAKTGPAKPVVEPVAPKAIKPAPVVKPVAPKVEKKVVAVAPKVEKKVEAKGKFSHNDIKRYTFLLYFLSQYHYSPSSCSPSSKSIC